MEKFLATEQKTMKQRKACYYRGWFLVPEARSVLTQVQCCHPPGGDRPQEIAGERSNYLALPLVQSTENTAADRASTLHQKLICNWFNLSLNRFFGGKDGPYLVIIIRYLVERVGNLKGWLRSSKKVKEIQLSQILTTFFAQILLCNKQAL